ASRKTRCGSSARRSPTCAPPSARRQPCPRRPTRPRRRGPRTRPILRWSSPSSRRRSRTYSSKRYPAATSCAPATASKARLPAPSTTSTSGGRRAQRTSIPAGRHEMLRGPCPRISWLLGGLALPLVLVAGLPPPLAALRAQSSASPRPYPVAIAPGNQHWPAAFGDFVVWLDDAESRPVMRANDLRTGNELRLSREGAAPAGPPAIGGQIVVWPDYRGDPSTTPSPEPHLYAYDLSTRTDFLLSPAAGRQAEPRIDGSLVVWTDYR